MTWIIMRDLKEFWRDSFMRKKGLSVFQRPNFWDNCVEYYWPSPKPKKTYTQKLIEACR